MEEQTLRAYLDRLAHVRSRFEVFQQDIREMLISLDGVFEALCRELQEVRAPLCGPEGPEQWVEAKPPFMQSGMFTSAPSDLNEGPIFPAHNPNGPNALTDFLASNGIDPTTLLSVTVPASGTGKAPLPQPYFDSKLGRDVYPEPAEVS